VTDAAKIRNGSDPTVGFADDVVSDGENGAYEQIDDDVIAEDKVSMLLNISSSLRTFS
jgi:hypothetical protein